MFIAKLIVTEKPSVAISYAKILGVHGRQDGYLEGNGYLVSWCVGHLVELAPPSAYGEQYVKWNIADLPILPEKWQYLVSASTKKQFGILKKLMHRADVNTVVNSCDAGREGELIFRLVYEQAGCKKPVSRLWLSSMEDSAVRAGFANLKPSTEYDALYQAALCRERADWMVGINCSRLFSCLYGRPLAVGRVMTPTLAMTVEREAAIAAFVPKKFYTVALELTSGFVASSRRISEKAAAEKLLAGCREEMVSTIQKITRKEKAENPPPLYDLTTLQRDANRLLGYPDHQKTLLRWNQVEKYIDLMIQSDRYLSDKEKRTIEFPLELNAASAAEYTALKEQYPDTLVGFEAGGNFMFYGEDAVKVSKIINGILLTEKTALGEVKVSGFSPSLWARKSKELWSAGNNVYLAGLNEDGTHHQTKYLRKEDYLPIGSVINMDGREFRVDGVDFDKGKVSLQDMALADVRMPIFREESLSLVRELYEQQDEALDAAPEKAVDYKVGDSVVVDLPTKTIEGTIGYVGETDVRIDTSAQGYSWSNEVLNKQQFEDGLRQDEPTPDEKLDKLPISVEINGEWQTFPDAAAADEALNVEPVPEAAGNFHITDDHLGEGGAKQKYARNIAAIRTLFQLEQEQRGATAEEQEVLAQYVGWGGLPDAFDPDKSNWTKEYTELKGLLSEDEYAAARSSVLNAHYTNPISVTKDGLKKEAVLVFLLSISL